MTQYKAVQKRSRLLIGLAGAMRNVTTLLLLGLIAALSIGDVAGGSDFGFALLLAVISVTAGLWVARGALPACARLLRDLVGAALVTQGRLAARRMGHGGYGIDYRIRLEGGRNSRCRGRTTNACTWACSYRCPTTHEPGSSPTSRPNKRPALVTRAPDNDSTPPNRPIIDA